MKTCVSRIKMANFIFYSSRSKYAVTSQSPSQLTTWRQPFDTKFVFGALHFEFCNANIRLGFGMGNVISRDCKLFRLI